MEKHTISAASNAKRNSKEIEANSPNRLLPQIHAFHYKPFFDKPQQLISKQYSSHICGPQDHWPISWNVMPQVRLGGEDLHKKQRKQTRYSQVNLFFNLFSSNLFSANKQNCPHQQENTEEDNPTLRKVKQ
jgi:hypothetical protein